MRDLQRRSFLKAGLAAAVAAQAAGSPPPDTRRRVLWVDVDDVGWRFLDMAPTPTVDRLRAIGLTFTRFWGGPSCSNFRARALSGLPAYHPKNLVGGILKKGADPGWSLPATTRLLPAILPGRATHRGKWHLARADHFAHPIECGFDEATGSLFNLKTSYFAWRKFDGLSGTEETTTVYATLDTVGDAWQDVQDGVEFVHVSLNAMHGPLHVPPPHLHTQGDPTEKIGLAIAVLEAADTALARLFAAAVRNGYTILLVADNGTTDDLAGEKAKGSLYEPGIRVPLIVAGPDVVRGTSGALVQATDLYATVAESMGLFLPLSRHHHSFWGRCVGDPTWQPRRTAFVDKFPNGGKPPKQKNWQRAIRDERWKLVARPGNEAWRYQLFDLETDPTESENRVGTGGAADQAFERLVARLPDLPSPS